MGKVNYTTEQVIGKLREAEVLCSQGKTIGEAVRQIGVREQTYYQCAEITVEYTAQMPRSTENWKKRMPG